VDRALQFKKLAIPAGRMGPRVWQTPAALRLQNPTELTEYIMTNVEIHNPSAFNPLRIFSQDRMRNTFEKAPAPAAPAPKHETRAELERRGAVITLKKMRVSTKFSSEMRDVPTPLWQAEGADSLAHWVTEALEHYQRTSQAPAPTPPVQHVVDAWGALQPRLSIPPGGKTLLQLEEHTRVAISCDEPVTLQLSNTSTARTIRLRTLDLASKEATHVAFIPPAKDYPSAAIVSANGTHAAVLELQPT
jgi:hypothetical protein